MNPERIDEAIDREIEALLAVEPSPGFAAGVRMRVAAGSKPVGWNRWLLVPAAAFAVAVAIALSVGTRRPVPIANESPVAREDAVAAPAAPPVPEAQVVRADDATPPPTSAAAPVPRAIAPGRAVPRPASRPEFDVLLSPSETAAWHRLFASVGPARVEPWPPAALDTPLEPVAVHDVPPVGSVDIEPVTMTSLEE